MEIFSGSEIVIRALIDQGIKYIFGYPGGSVLDIYDVLKKNSLIKHILVRHEQSATHMADGYARATGKIGVVLVTSGPGATNSITGIATAYMDSIPMIIISGQVDASLIGYDAFQECDMLGISRPIVKHSFLIKHIEDIPIIFKKSFLLAVTGRPGPVVIDIPKNILNHVNTKPYIQTQSIHIKPRYLKIPECNTKKLKQILKILLSAQKPIIYIGGGIIISNSSKKIQKLAEILNIPVTTSLMGLGAFPGQHPQNLHMIGMHGTYEANMAMHHADVILAIGVRFDDRTTNNIEKYCPHAQIIHIDIDPTSISKTIIANISIVGDAKEILHNLLQLLKYHNTYINPNRLIPWWIRITKWRKKNSLKYNTNSKKIKPQHVIEILWKLTKGQAYITTDVGQHQMFTALYYTFNKPRRWINSGGLGTMGFGLPAALGVKLALPKEKVICITGDGSIQMNIQELSTAMQYQLPILILNLNNRSLGMVRQWQDILYAGRHSHSYMKSLPNFVKLSESYGHIGISITQKNKLKKKLKFALEKLLNGYLVFVDIYIDHHEHVYPMQIKGGGMNEMRFKK
ncbi:biosynthetic-type acetolactate synthase large subunit [Buchnera aphidicola]|uniref:Acetolactate synthase n=1 Tax=Buchnera aphidicola (Stegophylla sp.) TaxID=2315800 RepID=A0A4D6YKG4_9GAMM|nr:biosynthetic-type acetolactate synthase large subunit [Buchnera aphidicola (Stegophylla sp.)]QCI26330.1 biosynthetic-type acetolactate synthase large subunit [Buchnera aphidicola (Stegophylla sp.)]